ncbi:hypothetical protein FDP41_001998 [Naegleria fowleri]|uniref:START domain-containing protein n=1 Tax=Naegleria fowleri TaxID=5763 RepID=A0A6A5BZ10_NAEFO|nr:uncharacterized protein FDP41_001998 [Naegleria fowleri]KAF0978928.1 hypothetical protein FDP41_001998 [Naegleria fowleri]CAG4708295.1 unnamed protein product [Naegleria fowleri]
MSHQQQHTQQLAETFDLARKWYEESRSSTAPHHGWTKYKTTDEGAHYWVNKDKHDYWVFQGEMSNVTVSKSVASSPRDIIHYLELEEKRLLWDEELVKSERIPFGSSSSSVSSIHDEEDFGAFYRVFSSGSRLISNREFVILRNIYKDPTHQDNVLWLVTKSGYEVPGYEHDKAPKNSFNVRGVVHLTAWRIELVKTEGENAYFNLFIMTHSEPGGWVKPSMYNNGVGDRPCATVLRLVKHLKGLSK